MKSLTQLHGFDLPSQSQNLFIICVSDQILQEEMFLTGLCMCKQKTSGEVSLILY